jgi:hypothetical protein
MNYYEGGRGEENLWTSIVRLSLMKLMTTTLN